MPERSIANCPNCGKFVSLDDGYYGPAVTCEPFVDVYCNQACCSASLEKSTNGIDNLPARPDGKAA